MCHCTLGSLEKLQKRGVSVHKLALAISTAIHEPCEVLYAFVRSRASETTPKHCCSSCTLIAGLPNAATLPRIDS